jgi:uncharacterized protein YegP (UPF0339 family)
MTTSRWLRSLFVVSALAITPVFAGCDVGDPTTGDEADLTTSTGVFQTFKGADGQYYFHLVAGNSEKVLQSEGYTTLSSAKKGVASVKTNAVNSKNYKLLQAESGDWYFNLVAKNGEIIGTSELYRTKTIANKAISTVKALVIKDLRTEAAATGGAKFSTFKGLDSKTYFHLQAANGEIVLQSEAYSSKSAALTGVESVRTNGRDAEAYEIVDSDNGQSFFHLVAANGEIIGVSEMYASHASAEAAVESLSALIASEKVADPK